VRRVVSRADGNVVGTGIQTVGLGLNTQLGRGHGTEQGAANELGAPRFVGERDRQFRPVMRAGGRDHGGVRPRQCRLDEVQQ